VIRAPYCLTCRDGEDYDDFVDRLKANPLAVRVKIADLEDNMDLRRLPALGDEDIERLKKYQKAWLKLKRKGP